MYKLSLFLIIIYCSCINLGNAQTDSDIQTYLKNRIEQLDNIDKYTIPKKEFRTNWVDGIDIRTETDEFDFDNQRYLLRVSPNTPKIRTAQSNLYQSFLDKATLQEKLLKKEIIEIAYNEVLDYYETTQKLNLKKELLIILQDQEKVYFKLNQRDGQISKDWLKIQEDVAQLEIDIYKDTEYLNNWRAINLRVNTLDLIPVENILNSLDKNDKSQFSLLGMEYEIENLIIKREEDLEKAEQKKWVDFFQIEYKGPHNNEIKERVSLVAAFRLPFSAGRKLKMEELAIEKDMLLQEKKIEQQIDTYKAQQIKDNIYLLAKELNFAIKQYTDYAQSMEIIVQRNSQLEGTNPLLLLFQKENQLKKEETILKLEITIYKEYLDYLKLTEQLYKPDYYGFLSK